MLGDHPHYLGIGIGSRLRQGKLRDPFEQVKHLLSEGDIVLGNLETVLSKSTSRHGLNRINMRGEPSCAQLLKEAGFNVISVANNHAMQHGITAWNESVKNLRAAGISVVGIKEEPTLFLEYRGKIIAILGFSLRPPQYGFLSPPYCLASAQEVREKTRQAKEKADIVILSLHWGEEYSSWPSAEQVQMGESFIGCGATLIVGHHPHVLQGVERKDNGIIAYSLGNFVSDMIMKRSRETAILSLRLNGGRIDELKLIPALIGEDSCPKVLESEEGSALLKLTEKYALFISLSKKADAQTAYLQEIKKSIKEFRYEFMIWLIHNWRKYPPTALFSVLGGIIIRKLLSPIKWLRENKTKTIPLEEIKKILILLVAGIGDLVMATPSIKALKTRFKDAYVGLLVIPRSAQLIESCPYIDDLFILDIKDVYLKNMFTRESFIKTYKAIKKLRQKKFDMLINLQRIGSWGGSFKMAVLCWLIGAKYKVGRDTDGRGFFFNFKIKESIREHTHDVEANLNVARALGANINEVKLELPIFEEDRLFISDFLTRGGISDKDLLIGFNPGAFRSYRRWLEKRWAQLADRLIGKYSCKIIITGDETEKKMIDRIAGLTGKKSIITTTNLKLKQLAALIERFDLFITNDSGPMHIAAVTGTPLIALFGPGNIHRISPYGGSNKSVIIRKEVNCRRPCYNVKCKDNKCMELITVEDVMKAAEGILG